MKKKNLLLAFILSFLCMGASTSCDNNKLSAAAVSDVPATKPAPAQVSVFKINIDRKIKGANCTQGYILVNGETIAYTLELPDLNNKEYISSIPKGTYAGQIRTDGSKGWRIELLNVPGRSNIQIHVGNYTNDIIGCILVGTKVDVDHCTVTNNFKKEAIDKLQSMFNKFTTNLVLNQGNTNPIEIEVEISGI